MKTRPHQRDHESNQQVAKSVRPQLPRDGSAGFERWQPGQLPMGGFRAILAVNDPYQGTKISNTSKPGNAGKKDII
jgi:hypothetical protein